VGPTQAEQVLNVTDVSQFVFCPRQFYISKVLGLRRQPPEFVEGSMEHDARRLLNQALGSAYAESVPEKVRLWNTASHIIGRVLDYAKKIALLQHPVFSKEIGIFANELSFRLQQEERERTRVLTCKPKGEGSWAEQVRGSFPVENEFSVFSRRLGLRGRIDEVYETADGTLAIRDIKTAPMGFPFDDSNQVQIGAYAMLLEEQVSKKVTRAAIYSSRNLAERQVMVDKDLEKRVVEAGQNVRRFLAKPELPAILTGSESVKCFFCFLREECRNLQSPDNDSRGIEALFNSQGKLSLFGDD
jgi:CRISPR/Cas system-associated exonuclease Cas4 (RecB family)